MSGSAERRIEPPAAFPGQVVVERLDNGLTVALLDNPQAPVVTTALWYRVGTRDEPAGHGGVAHFLEHMMFKGSPGFAAGEVDRRTQALGGDNNAFTSHDATAYHFNFAADRWREALEVEADRMAALTLDPTEVEAERRVILEEIAMYEDEPWDALALRVEAEVHGDHPYARPVLGTREELLATGPAELAAFHRRFYTPGNAVLAVGGDLSRDGGLSAALTAIEKHFGPLPGAPDGARPVTPAPRPRPGLRRIERHKGEVARLLMALPAPASADPDFVPLRVLVSALGGSRGSRLVRQLVDEEQLCAWATADLAEAQEPGLLALSAELVPGVEPAQVEARVLEILTGLATEPPRGAELDRTRAVLLADWTFGHEKVFQQTLALGAEVALFGRGFYASQLKALAAVTAEELAAVAARYFDRERSLLGRGLVVGWSLPLGDEDEGQGGSHLSLLKNGAAA